MNHDSTRSEYQNLLVEAYLGEVFGAALLAELLAADAHPEHRSDLRWLHLLEETTRQRLAPYLDLGLVSEDQRRHEQIGDESACSTAQQTWIEFLGETARVARETLPEFELLAALAPADARYDMDAVIDHERSLLAFATGAAGAAPLRAHLLSFPTESVPLPAWATKEL